MLQRPEIEVAMYNVPHPSEPIMTVQYQLKDNATITAKESLKESLKDLDQIMAILSNKFSDAM